MATHAYLSCTGRLVDVNLLYRLTRRVFVSPSDRVVEDVHFLDSWKVLAEHIFDFRVVTAAHCRIVREDLFLCWRFVDSEAGIVGVKAVRAVTNVVHASLVVPHLKGHAGPVDFAPWLFRCARGEVNVFEGGGRHSRGLQCW